jgi:phenylpyruvate tautomerase PptA (4-oxalocrotonate tautomerase family)
MPITVTATAGILSSDGEKQILPRLAEAMLARNGLTGNPFMTPNVVGSVHILPEGHVYAGGSPRAVFVELKVPSFAFTSQEQRQGFVEDVNAILADLTSGQHPKERTYVNVTHTLDGSWGIGDRAWTNAALGEAVAKASGAA